MGSWAGGLKSQLAGAFTVGAIGVAAKKVIDFGGKINDLSIRTGVSTKTLQQWNYAAEQNGGTLEDLTAAWRGFGIARQAALEDPKGDKMQSFKELGFTEQSLRDNPLLQSFEQAMEAVRTSNLGGDTEGIISKVFGKGGGALIATMKSGLKETNSEAEKLGIIIEEDTIASLDAMGDAVTRIKAQFQGPFAEAIKYVVNFLVEAGTWIQRIFMGAIAMFGAAMSAIEGGEWANVFSAAKDAWTDYQHTVDDELAALEAKAAASKKKQEDAMHLGFKKDPAGLAESNTKRLLDMEIELLSAVEKRKKYEEQIAKIVGEQAIAKQKQAQFKKLETQKAQLEKAIGDAEGEANAQGLKSKEAMGPRVKFLEGLKKEQKRIMDEALADYAAESAQNSKYGIQKTPALFSNLSDDRKARLDQLNAGIANEERRIAAGSQTVDLAATLKKELEKVVAEMKNWTTGEGPGNMGKSPEALAAEALAIADSLNKLPEDKAAKQDSFTPISDELSRIGGFTGASGTPQEGVKQEIKNGNKTQADVLQQIRTLVGDVKDMKAKLENL